jgi:hypothetical protein
LQSAILSYLGVISDHHCASPLTFFHHCRCVNASCDRHRKQQEYQDLLKQQIEEKQRKKEQVGALVHSFTG